MSKQYIKDLGDNDDIKSVFLVGEKQVLKDRKGKDYLNMYLSDKSGALNARMWDKVAETVSNFDSGDFVEIKGHVQVFQNRKQIVVHDLKRVDSDNVEITDFIAAGASDPKECYAQLLEIVSGLENQFVKDLIQKVLADDSVKEALMRAPAARSIHHAYIGGLLDHILSICKLMDFLASHYPILNRDLLMFGAIFHDIGKIRELKLDQGIHYTDEGRLVGHMGIALELIDEVTRTIDGFPQDLKDSLKHIVLSHHGRLEYGSPKRPKFLEAMMVAMIDDLDSKIDSMTKVMNAELDSDTDWTRYNPQFDRYLYLKFFREETNKK